jgi:hypothetical protein
MSKHAQRVFIIRPNINEGRGVKSSPKEESNNSMNIEDAKTLEH